LQHSPSGRAVAGSLAATALAQLSLLVSGVLTARMLGVEDRGHLALFTLIPAILGLIGGLGAPVAVTYFVASGSDARHVLSVLRPILVAQFLVLTPIQAALIFLLFRNSDPDVRQAAWISLPVLPAVLVQAYSVAVLQGQRRFRSLNLFRVLPPGA